MLTDVKSLKQCLAQGEYSTNVSYYHYELSQECRTRQVGFMEEKGTNPDSTVTNSV